MAPSAARQPVPVVLINGQVVGGILEAGVESSAFFSADRFSVRAALSAAGAAIWSAVPLLVEIRISVDGTVASLITGNADSVTIDPLRGEVRVAGRDFASLFVGAQLDQSFENQTSSEIATLLAQRQGLDATVDPTDGPIGRYYQTGRTRTALTQHARVTTEWDLLCWLAQIESYDVWVAGQTLYFQQPVQGSVALILRPGDCMSMKLHHALDIASGVNVTVRSWDSVSQQAVVQQASTGDSVAGLSRTIVRPNLSADDAQSLAAQIAGQISGHERRIVCDMPGDLTTMPRTTLSLGGTGTDFDGIYSICAVDRHIAFSRGFVQTIEARSLPWTAS